MVRLLGPRQSEVRSKARIAAAEADTRIVSKRYPAADLAFLGAAVLTSAATQFSHLDIVVFGDVSETAFREMISILNFGPL